MKNCIDCLNWRVDSFTPDYSEMTPGNQFAMYCAKQYWELDIESAYEDTLAKYLKMANKCKEFEDRKK
jgi:hypothetical protein